jgi:hypothetical protein
MRTLARLLVLMLAVVVGSASPVPAADETVNVTIRCPAQITWVANWPNKIGEDPSFKPVGADKIPYGANLQGTIVRDGQEMRCGYDFGGISATYHYKVHRTIVKCDPPAGGSIKCEVKKS